MFPFYVLVLPRRGSTECIWGGSSFNCGDEVLGIKQSFEFANQVNAMKNFLMLILLYLSLKKKYIN